jgi:hypothetical protein
MALYLKSFNHGVSQSSNGVTRIVRKLTLCVLHSIICFVMHSVKLRVTPSYSVVKFYFEQPPDYCNLNFKIC